MRLLPEEEIRFKLLENYWIHVTCDRRNYKLVGMSKENFPALPQFPHALVKIPAKLLADLIAKTTFAISLEESRYTLNGALMVLKPGSITMVATDGHRLAMVERDHKFANLSPSCCSSARSIRLCYIDLSNPPHLPDISNNVGPVKHILEQTSTPTLKGSSLYRLLMEPTSTTKARL